jgi:hypothetical protein
LSNEGKNFYFQNTIPHQETIQAHFQGTKVLHHKFLDKTIVEGINGEIYFSPEDKGQVKEGALSISRKTMASGTNLSSKILYNSALL